MICTCEFLARTYLHTRINYDKFGEAGVAYLVGAGGRVLRQAGHLDALVVFAKVKEPAAGVQKVTDHLVVYLTRTHTHTHTHRRLQYRIRKRLGMPQHPTTQ